MWGYTAIALVDKVNATQNEGTMSPDIQSLLNLPMTALITLACGYLGYRVAYTGKDQSHKAYDVIFISLVFGAIAQIVQDSIAFCFQDMPIILNALAAVLAVLMCSVLWRRFLERRVKSLLNVASGSRHDGYKTAWESILAQGLGAVSQIIVQTKDGNKYLSNMDVAGRIRPDRQYFGIDGSVSMFVTHHLDPDSSKWVNDSEYLISDRDGELITYFPADIITRIDIRAKEKAD